MKKILIGFLSATCFFLLVGATSSNSDNGRYQVFERKTGAYLLDTRTGKMYDRWYSEKTWYWVTEVEANAFKEERKH